MAYTNETWAKATPEEQEQEFERCKSRAYVYNTYFKRPEWPEITEDQFKSWEKSYLSYRLKLRSHYRPLIEFHVDPIKREKEIKVVPISLSPTMEAYLKTFGDVVNNWNKYVNDTLAIPSHLIGEQHGRQK